MNLNPRRRHLPMAAAFRTALFLQVISLLLFVLASTLAAPTVHAAMSAPSSPLPPCTLDANGDQQGACTNDSDGFSLDASGRLGVNATITMFLDSGIPACNTFGDNDGWSPSPCYSEVHGGVGGYSCYYIDLRDDKFKSGDCFDVLYKDPDAAKAAVQNATQNSNPYVALISLASNDGHNGDQKSCRHESNFALYVYGGDAGDPTAVWSSRGPASLRCKATFEGPRPDGMYGPTWIAGAMGVTEEYTGNGFRTSHDPHLTNNRAAHAYIPVDGDLRDLGVIAAFTAEVVGRKVNFTNQSMDPEGGSLTYKWDFGDGNNSTAVNPSNIYEDAGTYTVSLVARDGDGNEATATHSVTAVQALVVMLTAPTPPPKVGEQATISVDLMNYETSDISDITLDFGVDTSRLEVVGGPDPALPATLAKDAKTTVIYDVKALASGEAPFNANAQGRLVEGRTVAGSDNDSVRIPAQIALELSSSVKSETKVGDEIKIFLKLTNNEDKTITGITVEPLGILPNELLSPVSGPTSEDGDDPRTHRLSLAPGESTTVTFVYKAEQKGAGTLSAFVAGDDPGGGRFTAGTEGSIAIQSAKIGITGLRLSPGRPTPGEFGNLRGTVTNTGSVDVSGVDIVLTSVTDIQVLPETLARLDADISPRIATLAVGESHDFEVPVGVPITAGENPTYQLTLQMQGSAKVDGVDVDVADTQDLAGTMDLSKYWTTLLKEYKAQLEQQYDEFLKSFSDFADGVDEIGDDNTLAGVAIGTTEGAISSLQKMGNGLLTVGDLYKQSMTGELSYTLTEKGAFLAHALHEYRATHTDKQMLVDLANLEGDAALATPDATVGKFADWMFQVDKAYNAGDAREVSRLISEPATDIALAEGGSRAVSAAFAPVLEKIVAAGNTRLFPRGMKTAADDVPFINLLDAEQMAPPISEEQRAALAGKFYQDTGADIRDIPCGVPLSNDTAARLGVGGAEYQRMKAFAKETGQPIVTRPRPAEAAMYEELGYNPKSMPVKNKSINAIDEDWLGFPEGKRALVYVRDPVDPFEKLFKAVDDREIDILEALEIEDRYQLRKKEFEGRDKLLEKLNSVKTEERIITDGVGNKTKVTETFEGIRVLRNGREYVTKVKINPADGEMRYTINDLPVFSDNDLWYIGSLDPEAEPISLEMYKQFTDELGVSANLQHGITVHTSDFKDFEQGKDILSKYAGEHMRVGSPGEPLMVIGPNETYLTYVESLEINEPIEGGGEALYNKIGKVTYECKNAGAIGP